MNTRIAAVVLALSSVFMPLAAHAGTRAEFAREVPVVVQPVRAAHRVTVVHPVMAAHRFQVVERHAPLAHRVLARRMAHRNVR